MRQKATSLTSDMVPKADGEPADSVPDGEVAAEHSVQPDVRPRRASFPEGWWRPEPGARPLVLGHRGASARAPQNTLAAFREAQSVGADGVELDVHLSADGVPVVIHDYHVDGTTDGHGAVSAMTLAEIRRLDAGIGFGPAFAGEPVPTLTEVLEALDHRMRVNIELKAPPRGLGVPLEAEGRLVQLEDAVAEVVVREGAQSRVWFSSFKPYSLYRIRQLLPEVPCGLLMSPLTAPAALLAPLTPMEAVHLHHSMCRYWVVRLLQRRGRRVVAWTVDDPVVIAKLTAYGVDGLISNDPGAVLRQIGHSKPAG